MPNTIEFQLLILFTLTVKVDSTNRPRPLIEHNIVEPLETGSWKIGAPVVRHEELLFPAHENMLLVGPIRVLEIGARVLDLGGEWRKGLEAGPVGEVGFVGSAPGGVAGREGVAGADQFAGEVGGDAGEVFRKACGKLVSLVGI